jgi:cytochrome P450
MLSAEAARETVRTPPYVKGLPVVGVLLRLRAQPLAFLTRVAMEHGPIVRLRVGPIQYFLLSHPDYIQHVLQDHHTRYQKSVLYRKLWPLIGQGLVTSEDPEWRKNRRTIQPVFNRTHLAGLVDVMAKTVREAYTRFDGFATSGQPFDIAEEMMRLTERIIVRTMFSIDLDAGGKDWRILNEEIGRRFFALFGFAEKLPLPSNIRFNRTLDRRVRLVDEIIEDRRQNPAAHTDLLSMLLQARDPETGDGMSDHQIRDEVMTIFFAGHETTAVGLSWTWYLLDQHPQVQQAVIEEAKSVLDPDQLPDWETIGRLRYTRSVLEESMRLYPPVPWFSRTCIEDDVIDGYEIPKDAMVSIIPWIMHRHPRHWPDPERFDPSRFEAEEAANRHRYEFLPFGGGPRKCVGTHFAMTEAQLILASLAARYRFALVEGQSVEPKPLVSLRPNPGVQVVAHRR